ncbi:DUF3397 domain-containing protein [Litchfieldia salsa]|uniref:Uncharacterized protein n=1 Tax=Litchfieldia salsa TaxID=930152 RepID=A0A1H0REY5_9BACI|nr:DUF3397 domain-containing protein [Litchfieldia salsa]SDP28123.1 Protein of unknown function [Litchfieldia salsa]
MVSILASLSATIITLPIIGLAVIYFLSFIFLKNGKKTVLLTIDLSTLLLIFSVHYLLLVLLNQSYLWLIILVVISTVLIFGWIHWRKNTEINMKKVLKGSWRFTFLLFAISYLVLLVTGVIYSAIRAT